MNDSVLDLRSISKSFQGVQALREVSFDLKAGEVHALLGENGAGKSTLIKVITGAHSPDEGEIRVNGHKVERLDPGMARRLGIAAIYQQPALFADLSVSENIALALEAPAPFRRIRWGGRRAAAARLLRRVGARIDPDAFVCELSMPEQQLVEIARVLGTGARVLIMDEPTASLTPGEVSALQEAIRVLKQDGVGFVYISHRLPEVFELADRITVLRDGTSVGTFHAASLDESDLIRRMVGRDLSAEYPGACKHTGPVRLEVRDVGCVASGVPKVSFQLRSGEIVGLSGLVGAGRTELARVLFGITPPDSGQILVDGNEVRIVSPRSAAAAGICYLPEDRRRHGIVLEMSLLVNISLAIHDKVFPRGWILEDAERRLASRFVGELGIKCAGVEALAGSLSGGNQQKVALARWLAADPKVLILDEPTQGVDVGAKREIHRLIRSLADRGMAVLMISSDLPEVIGMSDRILVMRGGCLMGEFAREEATSDGVMSAALGKGGEAC